MVGTDQQALLFACTENRYRTSIAALTFQNGLEKVVLSGKNPTINASQWTQTCEDIEKAPLLLVRKIFIEMRGFLPTSIVVFPKYMGVN